MTAVHKANIMKLGDGLFLRSCQEIASLYPSIKFDDMIVDNTTMQVRKNTILKIWDQSYYTFYTKGAVHK